jgi:hypothetical protein
VDADFEYLCVQRIDRSGTLEHFLRAGRRPQERPVPTPESHLRYAPTGGAAVYEGVRALARLFVRAVYLFPVLLVVKIALWAADSWYSDLVTLAFVLLVVALFAIVSLLVLLHLVVGSRSQRRDKARLRFEPPGTKLDRVPEGRPLPASADALTLWARGEAAPAELCVSGRIDAGGGAIAGEPVLYDAWEETDGGLTRTFWAKRFALVADEQPPVIVDIHAAPQVLGDYLPDRGEAAPAGVAAAMDEGRRALGVAPRGQSQSCTLRHGDMVELVGRQPIAVDDVAEIALGRRRLAVASAEGGPYRAGEAVAGLLVSGAPLVVRAAGG